MREHLIDAHKEAAGNDDDLVIGLQLTHSGRFCKPNDNTKFESIIAYQSSDCSIANSAIRRTAR